MICGIKLLVFGEDNLKKLRDSKLLDFKPYKNGQKAVFNGLHFYLYLNLCKIDGSMHKFKNGGKHNADNFTLPEFSEAIYDLSEMFGIDFYSAKFCHLEFGFNIKLPFPVVKFLASIILYRGKITKYPSHEKYGIRFEFAEYDIKLYNKSDQCKYADENILRIEIVIKKMRRFHQKIANISTLGDLASFKVWHDFVWELLLQYDALVFLGCDTDIIELRKDGKITDAEAKLLIDGQKPYFLNDKNRMKRKQNFDEFKRLIDTHSSSEMKDFVRTFLIRTLFVFKLEVSRQRKQSKERRKSVE